MEQCLYCEHGEKLHSLMIPICECGFSKVFFFRDQKNPGRCIVELKDHKEEYFQLTKEERDGFFRDLAVVTKAIYNVYQPQKINYATYGDLVPHLHMHVVPKREGELSWGGPFTDAVDKVYLSDEAYDKAIAVLRAEIEAVEQSNFL